MSVHSKGDTMKKVEAKEKKVIDNVEKKELKKKPLTTKKKVIIFN